MNNRISKIEEDELRQGCGTTGMVGALGRGEGNGTD